MKASTPLNSLDAIKDNKISNFLKHLPHLYLSDTGLKNVANRFCISIEQLHQVIDHLQSRMNNGK